MTAERRREAVRIGPRTIAALAIASVFGVDRVRVAVLREPGIERSARAAIAPVIFGALLLLVLGVVLAQLSEGGLDAKALALLGVLSALGAALRPLGAGTAGVETIFFLLVDLGPRARARIRLQPRLHDAVRVGAHHRRRRARGCRTRCSRARGSASAPDSSPARPAAARSRMLVALRRGLGVLLRLAAQPVVLAVHARRRRRASRSFPARSVIENLHRYLLFDATTSLGWDTGRAITNALLIAPRRPRRARRPPTRRPQSLLRRPRDFEPPDLEPA